MRGVVGLVSYALLRSADDGVSVTTCASNAGSEECAWFADDWVR